MLKIAPKLLAGLSTVALGLAACPLAAADPTIPLDPGQLPGLEAVSSLSPVVQQAAANPGSAQSLLLAAASQLAGNATTPEGSLSLAQAVARFVQEGGAAGPAHRHRHLWRLPGPGALCLGRTPRASCPGG